ncbi:hypothetical protein [Streptomyces virginiae]|uniref:hypothetical protein n=1 Tax=Streptomyces virginiae TaxID=1961 RepID=UPI00368794B1
MLPELHGGCSVPIGARSESLPDGTLMLVGQVTSLDGKQQLSSRRAGSIDAPEALGRAVAKELLQAGAQPILNAARAVSDPL